MTHVLEPDFCPNCDAPVNAASVLSKPDDKSGPKIGDFAVCANCTSYLVFDEYMKLRECTVDEICDMNNNMLLELTRARNMFKRENERKKRVFSKIQNIFGILESNDNE